MAEHVTSGSYNGFTINALDAKHRLSIPSDFRSVIEKKSLVREVMLAPHHLGKPCLVGFDHAYVDQRLAEIALKYGAVRNEEREDELLMATGFASPVAFDESGRIILNSDLRADAGVDRFVVFVGLGETFQMWNPQTFLEANRHNPVAARKIAAMIAAKGA